MALYFHKVEYRPYVLAKNELASYHTLTTNFEPLKIISDDAFYNLDWKNLKQTQYEVIIFGYTFTVIPTIFTILRKPYLDKIILPETIEQVTVTYDQKQEIYDFLGGNLHHSDACYLAKIVSNTYGFFMICNDESMPLGMPLENITIWENHLENPTYYNLEAYLHHLLDHYNFYNGRIVDMTMKELLRKLLESDKFLHDIPLLPELQETAFDIFEKRGIVFRPDDLKIELVFS